jgi:O-methyltransferase
MDSLSGDGVKLYLDLLKRCVSNYIYDDDLDVLHGEFGIDPKTGKYVSTQAAPVIPEVKHLGGIWPSRAHTMIGIPRLENLQSCVEEVLKSGIQGDLIETGVWRGGATIFMRGILKAYGVTDRRVWVADSFAGLPQADYVRYPKESETAFHLFQDLAVSLEDVKRNFQRYGLLDEQVQFLKGWFRDTLPSAPIKKLAVMRLDGDLYESTLDALVNLYGKLSRGGFVIIDDYGAVKSCDDAVEDFRKERGVTSELFLIPGSGAYWRK